MDDPKLHKINSHSVRDSGKALIFIPGMFSEKKTIGGKYTDAIVNAGWDGELYHLWWDASKPETPIRMAIEVPIIGGLFKLKKIKDAAKKTGRKHLPNMLREQLPNKRITFVAHSLAAYMLYKLFKKPDKYPVTNPIDDVILLGGAVSKKKENWERTNFRELINVYNEHDKTLKKWKKLLRPVTGKFPVSPCGMRPVKTKYISKVVNVNLSDIVGSKHNKYHEVFLNGMLKYDGRNWITR